MFRVGIFIPVYRESKHLELLLHTLIEDTYPDKKIVVCIDEPTDKTRGLIAAMENVVEFHVSGDRLGKVTALNSAVAGTECETLIFLDSDIEVHQKGFVERIVDEITPFDIIDIKKKIIRDSYLARLVNYDYLSSNFTNFVFSKYLGKCLAFNGSAFAIKRGAWDHLGGFGKEICEDLDMATRAYIEGLRFGYAQDIEVYNSVSPSWRIWLKQRERWGLGQANWLKRYYLNLASSIREHASVMLTALMILFPCFPLLAVWFALPDTLYLNVIDLTLIIFAGRYIVFTLPVVVISLVVLTLKIFTILLIIFSCAAIVYYFFARYLEYPFSLFDFILFFFIYNPLWLTISIVSIIRITLWQNHIHLDWKV